jgi:hypothetical protein
MKGAGMVQCRQRERSLFEVLLLDGVLSGNLVGV